MSEKLESDSPSDAAACSRSLKTPEDFADTGTPITAWSFYEVFERKHCGKGWLRAQMGEMEHALDVARESLAAVKPLLAACDDLRDTEDWRGLAVILVNCRRLKGSHPELFPENE